MTAETKADEARRHDADVRGAVARLRAKIGDFAVAMVTAIAVAPSPDEMFAIQDKVFDTVEFVRGPT